MAANQPFNYKPERATYKEKSSEYVLNQVKKVKTIQQTVLGQTPAIDMASSITTLGNDLDSKYGLNTNTMDHMVRLFEGKHDLGIPDDKRYVSFDAKSAKPADIIFRVMGMLLAPILPEYIHPAGSAKDEQRRARVEGHLTHLDPWLFRKYQTRYDIRNRFWQLLVGRSYIQQSYLPTYWDKTVMGRNASETLGQSDSADVQAAKNKAYNSRVDGYRGHMGPPVFRECIDPRKVFPIMTPHGPDGYVKIYRVQRFELNQELGKFGKIAGFDKAGNVTDIAELKKPAGMELARQSDQADANSTVDYYEYLDDKVCYYVAGSNVIHKYQHNGGMKIFPAYGLQTGFDDYHLSSVGILWAVRNELPQFDFMRTLWVQKAYLDVFPQLFAQLGSDDEPLRKENGDPIEWDIEPMTVKQIRGQLINALKDASSGMDFRAAVEMFAGDIDLATIPGLARGIAGAQQPGYAINQLSQSMRALWSPVVESAGDQASAMFEHYVDIVVNQVGRPVTVYGETEDPNSGRMKGEYFTLDPDDVEPYHRVRARLQPELPIDTQGTMMTMAKLNQEGMVTWDQYVREGLKKNNPKAMRDQIIKDQAIRAWIPDAINDAKALGRVQLTNEVIQARSLDHLNAIGNMDLAALKAGRAKQPAPGEAPSQPAGAPALAPPPVGPGTPGTGPAVAPGTAGQTGGTIPPSVGVTGSNPNDPAPGFRG